MAEEIRDISLSHKRSFSIDGDLNRIIQLDTSDMNILVRMEETYPEIQQLALDATDKIIASKNNDEEGSSLAEVLKEIDAKMREKLDYVFASKVADACEPTGNMYDPVDGEFRFERIIEKLSDLYATDLKSEFKKMQNKVSKHTDKYVNKSTSKRNRK